MILIEKILELIISLLESLFGLLGETLETFISGVGKRKHAHTSNFISERELLSRNAAGFCLTGRRSLSAKDAYSNALIIGGTGVGKSSVVLLPSLYKMRGSFVVHDPSGELFEKSAASLVDRGYDVRVLNFAKPEISCGYNPVARAKTSSEMQKIASMLIDNALGKGKKDPFWNSQASSLLAALIATLHLEAEPYRNLANLRYLLNSMSGDPDAVDQLYAKHAQNDPALWLAYKSFVGLDEKVRSGVIATCLASLTLLGDNAVAQVTSVDSISFDNFRKRPTALFLQTSVGDVKYYSILTSLFLEQFFGYVLSRIPKENELDIFFLIDEASSLHFPNLQLSIANVRKSRAGIMLLVQDYNQLVSIYGREDAEAIRANCFAKMYFTGQPLDTAKELSDLMGEFDYKDEKGKTITRSLMSASEIRTMSSSEALIICGHNPPIKAKLRPYYKDSTFRAHSELTPPRMVGAGFGVVPILPLPQSKRSNAKA